MHIVTCKVLCAARLRGGQWDGVLWLVQYLRTSSLLWHHNNTIRLLALSYMCPQPASRVCTLSQQRGCHEVYTFRAEVGACILCSVDSWSEHWLCGTHGAYHQNIQHPCKSVLSGLFFYMSQFAFVLLIIFLVMFSMCAHYIVSSVDLHTVF